MWRSRVAQRCWKLPPVAAFWLVGLATLLQAGPPGGARADEAPTDGSAPALVLSLKAMDAALDGVPTLFPGPLLSTATGLDAIALLQLHQLEQGPAADLALESDRFGPSGQPPWTLWLPLGQEAASLEWELTTSSLRVESSHPLHDFGWEFAAADGGPLEPGAYRDADSFFRLNVLEVAPDGTLRLDVDFELGSSSAAPERGRLRLDAPPLDDPCSWVELTAEEAAGARVGRVSRTREPPQLSLGPDRILLQQQFDRRAAVSPDEARGLVSDDLPLLPRDDWSDAGSESGGPGVAPSGGEDAAEALAAVPSRGLEARAGPIPASSAGGAASHGQEGIQGGTSREGWSLAAGAAAPAAPLPPSPAQRSPAEASSTPEAESVPWEWILRAWLLRVSELTEALRGDSSRGLPR